MSKSHPNEKFREGAERKKAVSAGWCDKAEAGPAGGVCAKGFAECGCFLLKQARASGCVLEYVGALKGEPARVELCRFEVGNVAYMAGTLEERKRARCASGASKPS